MLGTYLRLLISLAGKLSENNKMQGPGWRMGGDLVWFSFGPLQILEMSSIIKKVQLCRYIKHQPYFPFLTVFEPIFSKIHKSTNFEPRLQNENQRN